MISISMQSLVAVFLTVPKIFRKNLPSVNPGNLYNFYPQHRVSAHKLIPTRANYHENFRALAATVPEI